MLDRIALSLAASAVGVGAFALASTGAAVASTHACASKGYSCGTNVNVYGNAFDVLGQRAVVNTPIVSWPNSPTDPAEDFIRTTAMPGVFRYEYAPRGVPSGLCVSNPAGGYAKDPGGPAGLVLRGCNNSMYQQFQNNISNLNGNELMSMADLLTVNPNGTGAQIGVDSQDLAMKHPGTYWKWES